jgi:hypothetical protein
MKNLTSTQKALLVWSILFLVAVVAIKFAQPSGRAAKLVGLFELLLAMATGIAIGFTASFRKA